MGAADLSVRRIDGDAAFAALQSDWNRLASRSESRSVFLRHEWFDAAWQWARDDAQLDVLCFNRGNDVCGIAPFVNRRTTAFGLPVTTKEFLSAPDAQLADLVAAADDVPAVCAALAQYLKDNAAHWDVLTLSKIPASSTTLVPLRQRLAALGLSADVQSAAPNLYLRLDDTWDQFYGRRSRRLKKGNNLVRNKLEAQFKSIEVSHVTGDGAESFLNEVIRISGASWKSTTGTTFDQSGPRAFIARLNEHAVSHGWLSGFVLYLDGRAAATEYQLNHDGDIHALRADFDMELEKWSPGTYLNMELLRRLFGTGKKRYLMGPGANPYKLRWAEHSEELVDLRATSSNLKARAISTCRNAVKLTKRLRERMAPAKPVTEAGGDS